MAEAWSEGDVAALARAGEASVVLRLRRTPQSVGDRGVLDLSGELGRPPGGEVEWLGRRYRLVRPSLGDLLGSLARGPQIVTPKDAFHLAYLAGVQPGRSVAEAGTGSGALTIVLATLVGPTGRVTSYEKRPEFLGAARANLERAGVADRVRLVLRDVAVEGIDATGLTSVLLDLPEPWEVVRSAEAALVPGGYLATYTPTYNQLERAVRTLREAGLGDVRALELLERPIQVGDGGTRPASEMLGHTGFLAAGRKVG
jgi:tRNA (adenine57-N1/adenine58-N1)-methyltransferase catalytic subunit